MTGGERKSRRHNKKQRGGVWKHPPRSCDPPAAPEQVNQFSPADISLAGVPEWTVSSKTTNQQRLNGINKAVQDIQLVGSQSLAWVMQHPTQAMAAMRVSGMAENIVKTSINAVLSFSTLKHKLLCCLEVHHSLATQQGHVVVCMPRPVIMNAFGVHCP
jgi:hypothetical protein